MQYKPFRGTGPIQAEGSVTAHGAVNIANLREPEGYIAGEGLTRAVNVALSLSMPLLVTGEPGTGKTQLAYRVAAELRLGEPLRFDTKSSSVANDLFYSFDSVRHFAQAQLNAAAKIDLPPAQNFVRYQALGEAILRTLPASQTQAFGLERPKSDAARQSVVLIDEIDKAPRDFPNDLLNQIENLEFDVPELRTHKVRVNRDYVPVVIITSNSEKQLPEPFLRRCVYHHIEFPKREEIDEILALRLRGLQLKGAGFAGALDFFYELRQAGLTKKPSTSELLDWLRTLAAHGLDTQRPFAEQHTLAGGCIGTLAKTQEDRVAVEKRLQG